MALTQKPDFAFKHVSQTGTELTGEPATIKTNLDSQAKELRDWLNGTHLPEVDATFETKTNITTTRRLSATGDFTGTWNGVPFAEAEPQLSAEVINARGGFNNLNERISGKAINVMAPPAPLVAPVGDGVTNDTARLQAIFDHAESNNITQVVFPYATFKIPGGVTIRGYGTNVLGFGTILLDGTVNVRGAERTQDLAIPDFNFRCKGIHFKANDNTINLLSFKNVRVVDIQECLFTNGNKAIVFEASNYSKSCNQAIINNCRFFDPNYVIYANKNVQDQYGFNVDWGIGDMQFTNNQCRLPKITHIWGEKIDGLVMTGNTMFHTVSSATAEYHLKIDGINWGIIQGNNLFSAGYESIYITNFKGLNIKGNNFVFCGHREPRSAIYLADGDSSGTNRCSSLVDGNIIFDATKHGIEVNTGSDEVVIGTNLIRNLGVGQYYTGATSLASIEHKPVSMGGKKSVLAGNLWPEGNTDIVELLNATNAVTNGNFVNTTGWTPSNGTAAAANNVYSLTGTGGSANPNSSQETSIACAENKVIYLTAKMKVTNSSCESVRLQYKGSTGGNLVSAVTKYTPGANKEYLMSAKITLDATHTGNFKIHLYQFYVDDATANGKVLEVQEVLAIDLTSLFGAGSEPSLQECTKLFTPWFDGSKDIIPLISADTSIRQI